MSKTMYLPPLQPVINRDIYVSGDVTIHPQAAIASGVILRAAPASRIIISEGACLGMGTILNAYEGSITIKTGAVLGAGVLIIGKVVVEANACVGAATTIIDTDIAADTIVSAGSLLGDHSRPVDLSVNEPKLEETQVAEADLATPEKEKSDAEEAEILEADIETSPSESETKNAEETEFEVKTEKTKPTTGTKSGKTPIVGKMYVNNLLITLFPQGQSLNRGQKKDGNGEDI